MSFKKYDGSAWQPITPKTLKGIPYSGTLPATITGTKAGYLQRYKVYGNVGENLFDYRREFDGQTTDTTYFRYYLLQLQPNTSYSIYSNAPSVTSTNEPSFIITADEDPFNTATGGIWKNQAFTMTTKASGLVKVGLRKAKGTTSTIPILTENDFATGTYWLNLVEGSTVSDNYIPYEECGERTENLFNPQDVAIGKYIASDGTEGTSSGTGNLTLNHSAMVAVSPLTAYTFYISKSTANQAVQNAFCWFDENGTIITRNTFDVEYWETKITKTYQSPSNAAFLIINFRGTTDKFASGMIVEGSTVPEDYIPYGYKLPLTSAGQSVDIYLGDDTLIFPLTSALMANG